MNSVIIIIDSNSWVIVQLSLNIEADFFCNLSSIEYGKQVLISFPFLFCMLLSFICLFTLDIINKINF